MDARDICGVLLNFNANANNIGYSDWYIPAAGQLYEIYTHKTNINTALTAMGCTKFSDDTYWSSSEYNDEDGWDVSFYNGYVDNNHKFLNRRVRFVRDI